MNFAGILNALNFWHPNSDIGSLTKITHSADEVNLGYYVGSSYIHKMLTDAELLSLCYLNTCVYMLLSWHDKVYLVRRRYCMSTITNDDIVDIRFVEVHPNSILVSTERSDISDLIVVYVTNGNQSYYTADLDKTAKHPMIRDIKQSGLESFEGRTYHVSIATNGRLILNLGAARIPLSVSCLFGYVPIDIVLSEEHILYGIAESVDRSHKKLFIANLFAETDTPASSYDTNSLVETIKLYRTDQGKLIKCYNVYGELVVTTSADL